MFVSDKSVFSFLRQLTTWHCRGAAAADRRPTSRAAIDRYLLVAEPTAANPPQRRAAAAGWNRRTDRQTDRRTDRCIDYVPQSSWAEPMRNFAVC